MAAQKKITDLQLISAIDDSLSIPGDDGIQTYRFTPAQLKTYLNPMNAGGQIIYGGASGVQTALANGTLNQLLKSSAGTAAPAWTHAIHGDVQTKTTTYTALISDAIVLCSTAGGAWTLTWPAASTATGKILGAKKTTSDFAAVTISGTGMTTNYLMTNGETVFFISDGSNWHQIFRVTDTPWTAFTPTGTWSANTTYTGFWKRESDSILMDIKIALSGAPTGTQSVNIVNNSGWTIDTAKFAYANGFNNSMGLVTCYDNGVGAYGGTVGYASTTAFSPFVSNAGGTYLTTQNAITATVPMTWANTDVMTIRTFPLPITNFAS